jgi:hypothetical protein
MEIIKDSLILYYKYINIFNINYPKITSTKFIDVYSDNDRNKVIINKDEFNYSVIGRYDSSTNFWEWGWSFETVKNKIYDTKGFLFYAIDETDKDNTLIKDILINSKIKINENINLDIILAVSLRLLHINKYLFIHKIQESDTITKYIALKLVSN